MRRGSIRRPVLIYALVFMLALAFTIVTFAALGLLRASQRGFIEAARVEAAGLAAQGSWERVQSAVLERRAEGRLVAVVTMGSSAFGIGLLEARGVSARPETSEAFAAAPVPGASGEAYVVTIVDPSDGFRAARHEIRRLLMVAVVAAALLATLLAFMLGRLVLGPLATLGRVAADILPPSLENAETPNEIAEVAHTFQRTLRQLKAERAAIEQQHRELERMQMSLVRASKLASVGRLAAGVAHEIGNPLAAVLGYLKLMKKGLSEVELADVADRSADQLNRIHTTIRKLLTYARQDEQAGEIEPLSTATLVGDTLELLRSHPALRNVRMQDETKGSHDEEPDALGHPGPLSQVLINLIVNAAQAAEQREDPVVVLRRSVREGHVLLVVADNGPGVPAERREQIFDPFFTTKSPGEGTGLGLAISRSLVEGMNGELTVDDAPEGGAEFTVKLQRAPPEPREP